MYNLPNTAMEPAFTASPGGIDAGDNRLPVLAAEIEAMDGELMPPPKRVARERLSGSDEDKLGELIKAEHEAGERSLKDAVKHFMKCGDFLLQVKAGLPHGRFAFFLEHTAKLHPRMAQRYMMLARELPKLPKQTRHAVSQMSLRDAIGELSRTSGRAAKLPAPALATALAEASREPLKQTVIKAANAKHYVSTPAPQVIERPPTGAPVQPDPLPKPPHVESLVRALHRTVGVWVKTYPDMNAAEACEALNEVYCAIQDDGLSIVVGVAS